MVPESDGKQCGGQLFGLANVFRIAASLRSKLSRSYLESLETAVRTSFGIRCISFTPRFGQIVEIMVSARNDPKPPPLCFFKYFCARTNRTNRDDLSARKVLRNSVEQSSHLPSFSVSYSPVPRFEPQACASKIDLPRSSDRAR